MARKLYSTTLWPYPGCMQDPSDVVDKVRAASSGTAGACRGTAAPSDNLHAHTQWVLVVFHKHHTWAPLGSWPWGSAGLRVRKVQTAVKGNYDRMVVWTSLRKESEGFYHRKVSGPSAAFSGRGNNRST